MATVDPVRAVRLARIRMALRRATGKMLDVEALLGHPASAADSLRTWRALGNADLNLLLDEHEFGGTPPRAAAHSPTHSPTHPPAARHPADPAGPANPANPDTPKPPADPRYLRGAR